MGFACFFSKPRSFLPPLFQMVTHLSRATHHRPRVIRVGAVEGLDVLELKHVSLYKGLADLLVGPRDEELVVVVGLLRQPRREVDRGLEVHPLPAE